MDKILLLRFLSIYFTKIKLSAVYSIVLLLSFSSQLYAQTDTCASPTSLALGTSCITTNYNVQNTYTNDGATPPCGSTSYRDGWYTFTTDATTTSVTASGTSNREMGIAIYSGTGTCNTLTLVACTVPNGANASLTATVLPNTTYRLRIMRTNNANNNDMTGTICVYSSNAPTNDACSNAITLSVTSSCNYVTYTNANATNSSETPLPTCASYNGGDIWFKAVVPFTGILTVDMQTGTMTDSGMAFYSGSCGSLTLLACDDDTSVNGNMSYISLSGLTPGNTIYIRVWEYGNDSNGTFGICATSPTCVTPALNATTNITFTSATIGWTAPTSVPSNGYQYVVSLVNTTPTGTGTATTATAVNLASLTSNTTYYVFIRSDCGSGDFSAWSASGTFTTGYCPSTSTSSTYYINNFSTTGGTTNITNNGSGYSAGGYGNFTAQAVSQINYGTVSFSTAFFNGTNTYGFNIWVDWNNDLDFNDTGELVYASGAYVTGATGTFTVPGTASVGSHRMRIRADYWLTNPTACGTITSGETEDYTFTVLPPLPCSGNPNNVSVFVTSQTTATVSWTEISPAPANGYNYYVSPTNTTPTAATTPSGSTAAGITTANLTLLTPATTYYIWVRANCGGALGLGVWVGPISFYQPNCNIGSGSGTTALGCPGALAGELGSGGLDATLNYCTTSGCANLEVSYLTVGDTSSYTVTPITYAPPYQFNCLRNPVSVELDDVWSPVVNLPFNFCFYGNTYDNCVIGSNGIISFNTALANGPSGYAFSNNLPSTTGALFANSIYGVYHDIDPDQGGEVGWELITLNTGCRALVASWYNVPMFSDNSILYTGMMVLYENTNVIEVYVKEKRIDNNNISPWNGGNAIIGIQNADATQALVAPGRNGLETNWTATLSNNTQEAWRFTPSGPSISTTTWYEGAGTTGPIVGTTDVINVCPTTTTTYTVDVSYLLCNGSKLSKKDQTTVIVSPNKVWDGSVDNDWDKADNWTPSGIPNSTDCVVIPNTTIKPVVSGNGYNALSGTLSILNGARLTINSNSNLTGTNWVSVKPTGDFQIENNASLIQVNNVANIGNVTYKRNATVKKFDYVYWSSPVANSNVSNIASPLVSGGIYRWNTTVPNGNNGQGNWEAASGNTMLAGKGYIVRSPDSFPMTSSTLNGVFTGVPNNGDITFTIYRGSDTNTALHYGANGIEINRYSDNWNLIGNPYPSSIRASRFLFDNSTKIEGNVRLWTHGTVPSSAFPNPFYGTFGANYSPNDYITFNFSGTSCCPLAEDDFFIGAGQGFFVQMKDGLPSPSSDVVTFTNNLRNYTFSNSTFYRTSNQYTDQDQLLNIERNRIWLDIMNASEQSSRILVGYIEGATMEWDSFFDANTNTGTAMNLYSLIDHSKFIIQGRALPFDIHDEVPLGCVIPAAGTYSIGIAGLDGLFENQDIYIKDALLDTINDIKTAPYQFTSAAGKFDNRFSIVYLNNTLGNPNFGYENNVKVVTNDAVIVHSGTEPMESIVVYDVLGRKLASYNNIYATEFTLQNLLKNNTTLLLQIKLQNGTIVNEKVIY